MSGFDRESNIGEGRSVPTSYGRNGMDQCINKVKEGVVKNFVLFVCIVYLHPTSMSTVVACVEPSTLPTELVFISRDTSRHYYYAGF